MGLKTENLAIVLTDIVGFTETTAQQSRQENEFLLDTHNQILLPIIKKYKGRLVKSIGDALLLVFRSPTDAMLCSMAMQDALFEYNRDIPDQRQIHIRVAASLGEVRITRNDIFGEPVNTTSRIEGVTPKDEIYFSEAIYMAMNK
ncbi:MAG: adenylate/guanylate cyclase domain-containing protein, partial [Acidiferrobacterales bacterium]